MGTGNGFLEILNILTYPLQLIEYLVHSALDILVFQVLQLGPYLPIHF